MGRVLKNCTQVKVKVEDSVDIDPRSLGLQETDSLSILLGSSSLLLTAVWQDIDLPEPFDIPL